VFFFSFSFLFAGTHKVPEKYSIGKKMTNVALEILNLNKKEIITMDTISNHDFTEVNIFCLVSCLMFSPRGSIFRSPYLIVLSSLSC
jgi:hypothetical protein